jgi:3-methyladenine DNA glycosylase AlkD
VNTAQPSGLQAALIQALVGIAQPADAAAMQAYMKSSLPFWGIAAPQRRRVVAAVAQRFDAPSATDVLQLWRSATHREQRYAALDLLRLPRVKKQLDLSWLSAVQELVLTGDWWDHNDELSGQVLPVLLQRHPGPIKPLLLQWASSQNLWQRRAAMLAQRSLKTGFDAPLLYACILPSLLPPAGNTGSTGHSGHALAQEFFIRKGMGWALRERSYAAPAEVQAFCDEYRSQLSPLTLREALKVVHKRSATTAPIKPS